MKNNERLVYGWRKIMENITHGYGNTRDNNGFITCGLTKNNGKYHVWLWSSHMKATSDKSIIFTCDDHNHA